MFRRMLHKLRNYLFMVTPEPPEPPKPTTFEEAVDYVCQRIEPETVTDPYFHFTGGMAMRNSLGLWDKESPLNKHMVLRFGLCHGDDLGMLISHAADARKNGRTYCSDEDVWRCKQHWLAAGYDPATMERLPGFEDKTNTTMYYEVHKGTSSLKVDRIDPKRILTTCTTDANLFGEELFEGLYVKIAEMVNVLVARGAQEDQIVVCVLPYMLKDLEKAAENFKDNAGRWELVWDNNMPADQVELLSPIGKVVLRVCHFGERAGE